MNEDKPQTENLDWRYRVVTTVAEDGVLPSGQAVAKGTPVSVTTFIKYGDQEMAIGDPSAPALFLNQSHKAYQRAMQLHPFENCSPSGNQSAVSTQVYDYLENISASVVFACTALEAFANEAVPENFTHEIPKASGRLLVAYQKHSIERHISLDEKLSTVLPRAFGTQSPKGRQVWADYIRLRRLRDKIVHLKTADRSHSKVSDRHPDSIWTELLKPDQPDYPLIAKNMILHFRNRENTHWLKYCPF